MVTCNPLKQTRVCGSVCIPNWKNCKKGTGVGPRTVPVAPDGVPDCRTGHKCRSTCVALNKACTLGPFAAYFRRLRDYILVDRRVPFEFATVAANLLVVDLSQGFNPFSVNHWEITNALVEASFYFDGSVAYNGGGTFTRAPLFDVVYRYNLRGSESVRLCAVGDLACHTAYNFGGYGPADASIAGVPAPGSVVVYPGVVLPVPPYPGVHREIPFWGHYLPASGRRLSVAHAAGRAVISNGGTFDAAVIASFAAVRQGRVAVPPVPPPPPIPPAVSAAGVGPAVTVAQYAAAAGVTVAQYRQNVLAAIAAASAAAASTPHAVVVAAGAPAAAVAGPVVPVARRVRRAVGSTVLVVPAPGVGVGYDPGRFLYLVYTAYKKASVGSNADRHPGGSISGLENRFAVHVGSRGSHVWDPSTSSYSPTILLYHVFKIDISKHYWLSEIGSTVDGVHVGLRCYTYRLSDGTNLLGLATEYNSPDWFRRNFLSGGPSVLQEADYVLHQVFYNRASYSGLSAANQHLRPYVYWLGPASSGPASDKALYLWAKKMLKTKRTYAKYGTVYDVDSKFLAKRDVLV